MWAYSRIDTVRDPDILKLLRSAGIKWLALGIESADKTVRVWDLKTGKCLQMLTNKANISAVSLFGSFIVISNSDGIARIWKAID